jgi:hypothetical protein
MFNLLAILAVMLSIGSIPIITTLLFIKKGRDDLEFQRELLPTAVQVEKIQMSWRARHQTPDREWLGGRATLKRSILLKRSRHLSELFMPPGIGINFNKMRSGAVLLRAGISPASG